MAFSDPETRMAFGNTFKEFPILETERLILDQILPEEAEEYHRLQRSALEMPNRPPWGFGIETQSVELAHNSIQYSHNAWKKKAELRFGVRLKPEFQAQSVEPSAAPILVGVCCLFNFANQHKAELGYWLGAAYQNQGIMTEAVRAVVTYAFDAMRMGRIYALTSTRNHPSIAMLQKLGFIKEGVLRRDSIRDGVWDDSALCALLKDDFAVR